MVKRKAQVTSVIVIRSIVLNLQDRYRITQEEPFDIDGGATYRPDVVLRDKNNNRIVAIIEIENRTGRKHMVGGVITADYCMHKRKQEPTMFVVSFDDQRRKSYQDRLKMLQGYAKCLKKIVIYDVKDATTNIKKALAAKRR